MEISARSTQSREGAAFRGCVPFLRLPNRTPLHSNRHSPELEFGLSHRKQRVGHVSNRHKFAFCIFPLDSSPLGDPVSRRCSKLLDIELNYRKQSTSHFLIDNFRALKSQSFSNRPTPRLEMPVSHTKQTIASILIVPKRAKSNSALAFFDGLGMNGDAGDLWKLFLDAVFERGGDIMDLSNWQVAIHSAVARNQDTVLHAADMNFMTVHELVKLGRETIDEFAHASSQLIHFLAAGDVRAKRLDVDVDAGIAAGFSKQIFFE